MARTDRAILIVPQIVDDLKDDHELALLVWLISKANRSSKPYPWKLEDGEIVNLEQNQTFLNVTSYAKARGLSRKLVRARLDSLKRRATIGTQEVHRKGLIVTVVNLEKYQTLANYGGGRAASGATSGPQQGPPYHSDNHLDKSSTAPARETGPDFHSQVLNRFPRERRTSPAEAEREYFALDIETRKRCAARVPEWCEFYERVLLEERKYTPGLHNWIFKRVFDEPRETWEHRVKTRKAGGGWSW